MCCGRTGAAYVGGMLIAEDLLLLLYDDESGKPITGSPGLDYALAGAVLIELTVLGKLDITSAGDGVKRRSAEGAGRHADRGRDPGRAAGLRGGQARQAAQGPDRPAFEEAARPTARPARRARCAAGGPGQGARSVPGDALAGQGCAARGRGAFQARERAEGGHDAGRAHRRADRVAERAERRTEGRHRRGGQEGAQAAGEGDRRVGLGGGRGEEGRHRDAGRGHHGDRRASSTAAASGSS